MNSSSRPRRPAKSQGAQALLYLGGALLFSFGLALAIVYLKTPLGYRQRPGMAPAATTAHP